MKRLSRVLFIAVPVVLLLVFVGPAQITALAGSTAAILDDDHGLSITKSVYGTTTAVPACPATPCSNPPIAAQGVDKYTLTDRERMEVKIITFGGIITSLKLGSEDTAADVVLGFKTLKDYETKNGGPLTPAPHTGPYFGAIIGRYGNRIAKGTFQLKGTTHCLDVNNGPNSLHGGITGFNAVVWDVTKVINTGDSVGLTLHYLSNAGEGWNSSENNNAGCVGMGGKTGYPGNLDVSVTYTLNRKDELHIDYKASTDAPTVVNLTNHTYWNLRGEGTGTIYDHLLMLNAGKFTPDNATLIPTGVLAPVAGTVFDFSRAKPVNDGIRSNDPQIVIGKGFDHNWVLNPPKSNGLNLAATVVDPSMGRTLKVLTDQPGIQFYAGNFLDGSLYGISDRAYRQSDGLALETQHFPNSPNQPTFPSTELDPGTTLTTTTVFALTGRGESD